MEIALRKNEREEKGREVGEREGGFRGHLKPGEPSMGREIGLGNRE